VYFSPERKTSAIPSLPFASHMQASIVHTAPKPPIFPSPPRNSSKYRGPQAHSSKLAPPAYHLQSRTPKKQDRQAGGWPNPSSISLSLSGKSNADLMHRLTDGSIINPSAKNSRHPLHPYPTLPHPDLPSIAQPTPRLASPPSIPIIINS
jgi:hypothetical protein